jgi:hypothetical protein
MDLVRKIIVLFNLFSTRRSSGLCFFGPDFATFTADQDLLSYLYVAPLYQCRISVFLDAHPRFSVASVW